MEGPDRQTGAMDRTIHGPEKIRALFDHRRLAWLHEDVAAYLDCFHDAFEFRSPQHPEPLRGKAAYTELVQRSHSAVRPIAFDLLHLAVDGETALAEWHIAVELRADGRRIEWHGMSSFTFEGERIRTWRELWDPLPR